MKHRLMWFVAAGVIAACAESRGASVSDSAAGQAILAQQRVAALGESLRVVQKASERESIEKDLLVREVHSYDSFMEQLQGEFRRIRMLQQEAGTLDPRADPLTTVESERTQILTEARAARLRLSRLEAAAEQQGRQLSALRDSVRASADDALQSGS